jgi:hypothetical protein
MSTATCIECVIPALACTRIQTHGSPRPTNEQSKTLPHANHDGILLKALKSLLASKQES